MRQIIPILSVFILLIATGCEKKDNSTTTSPYAQVTAFTFASDTANVGLTAATYKVEERSDTGLIYNADSLRFGTSLQRVVPRVTYKTAPGAATFFLPDTTIQSTGSDTLDFTKSPIYLYVKSSDLQHDKWYRLSFTVHQVDPDLYIWEQLTPQVFKAQMCDEKAFWTDNGLALFVNNGYKTTLYRSPDGVVWREENTNGLPLQCRVRNIVQCGDTMYYADGDNLYKTADCVYWTVSDYSGYPFEFVNMLMAFHDKAWCILRNRTTQQLLLGYIQQGEVVPAEDIVDLNRSNVLPETFPVSDFAALSFTSSSERPRAMVIGGRSQNGTALNTRWNIEYEPSAGYRIKNFSIEQPSFRSLTGMSVIQYNRQLWMFGGIDNDISWRSDILYSDDEGMHWQVPDTTKNSLPKAVHARQKQTVVVDPSNRIYLIGGQTYTETFSDVYCGYLNSINW